MKALSVFQITQKIKQLLEGEFFSPVAISGEISGFSVSPSGHAYFTLKDERSKIKGVIFRKFLASLGYIPKNGDKVVVRGDIRLYEPDGSYQVIVKKVEYDSIGDFYKRFEEIKRKLEAEGLFDTNHKKALPILIRKVAVVTSPSGAAIKDFLVTLDQHSVGFDIDIWPAQVQGEAAVPGVVRAISLAGQMIDSYDVLVVMRGGGSVEDLSIFNDEFIARAVFASQVPTVSAIGHERDISICDFTADVRVATPTASAELLCAGIDQFRNEVKVLNRQLVQKVEMTLMRSAQSLDTAIAIVDKFSPERQLEHFKELLRGVIGQIESRTVSSIRDQQYLLDKIIHVIDNTEIIKRIPGYQSDIEMCIQQIRHAVSRKLEQSRNEVNLSMSKISLLNPEIPLEKGYAIVQKVNETVDSIMGVNLDDELEIILKDGYINSFVTGKRQKR